MNFRFVVIDEPIHVAERSAQLLWLNTIYAKEKGYRSHYSTSVLPLSTEDFFGTHLIIAEEKVNGELEPAIMFKTVRRSQSQRFGVSFGPQSIVQGSDFETAPDLMAALEDSSEIAYVSSWATNPTYAQIPGVGRRLRNYITTALMFHQELTGCERWIAAGVCRRNVDEYLSWLGMRPITGEFPLQIIDGGNVRMFIMDSSSCRSKAAMSVADSLRGEWSTRISFGPSVRENRSVA